MTGKKWARIAPPRDLTSGQVKQMAAAVSLLVRVKMMFQGLACLKF